MMNCLSWFKRNQVKQILVLGMENTGKFSLFQALLDNHFDEESIKPQLTDFNLNVKVNDKPNHLHFYIDSTAEDRKKLPLSPYAVLCIIDLSGETAEMDYQDYKSRVAIHYPNSKTLFVGTKQDLCVKSLNFPELVITSAKTRMGIDALKHSLENLGIHQPYQSKTPGLK